MLLLNNISKSFIQRGLVLNNLSLAVNEGDTLAIMGPSGSGKTTLLNIIGRLDKPDSGEITFREISLSSFNDDDAAVYRNRNIGFVFQDHLLLPYLTVEENIFLPLLASKYSGVELSMRQQYLTELMNKTGISDLRKKYPFTISGGEAQRVALVRALANKPSVLLADEPTGSLDSKNADILGDLLIEMNREFGITIIIATHSADMAAKTSKTYRLDEGILIDYK